MSWRDRMGQGRFRDAAFYLDAAECAGGRRGVTHEYPFRDEPFREDLGRGTRTFTVEAHVIGEEYFTARDALFRALEAPGPGELIHPFYGTLRVAVVSYRVRESKDEGGMASFSIEFVETAAEPAQPTSVPDTATKLRSNSALARAAVTTEFNDSYAPGVLMDSVVGVVRGLTATINSALVSLNLDAQEAAGFKRQLDALSESAAALAVAPANLLAELEELFGSFGSGKDEAIVAAYHFDPGVRPPSTTSNRMVEQANFDTLQRLIQRYAVIRAAELALERDYESHEAAVAARDEITDLLDEQIEQAGDDVYPTLVQLRADLVRGVPGEGSDLPRIVNFTPPVTVPSLVLAQTLFGDVASELDLVARNNMRHPGFVPGGDPVEVLSRA